MSLTEPATAPDPIAHQRDLTLPECVQPDVAVTTGLGARLERYRNMPGASFKLPGYSHHWLIVQENKGPEDFLVGDQRQERDLSQSAWDNAILYMPAYQPTEWDFSFVAGCIHLLMPDGPLIEAMVDQSLPRTALADLSLWLGEPDAVLAKALRQLGPWLDDGSGSPPTPDPMAFGEALHGIAWRLVARQLGAKAVLPPPDRRRLSNEALARVRAMVHARFREPITLEEMADLTGMNMFEFTRKFKLKVGISPVRYVQRVRVAHVRAGLADPRKAHLPLAELALGAGFCDQSHMTRVFKDVCGVTPAVARAARGYRS